MNKTDRLLTLIDEYAEGKQNKLAEILNLTSASINKWVTRDTFNADLLLSAFPDLSAEWLMRGKGPMRIQEQISETSELQSRIRKLEIIIASQRKLIDDLTDLVSSAEYHNDVPALCMVADTVNQYSNKQNP